MERAIKTFTIANGEQTSGELSMGLGQLLGLFMPGTFTGTAITFLASDTSGGTFVDVYDVGGASAYSLTVAAGRFVPVDPRVFVGFAFIKIKSGSAEGGARSVKASVRPVS